MKIFYITLLTLLTVLNATVASSRNWNSASLEIVAETDGSAELSGFHFLKSFTDTASNFSGYFGGGPVYVSLPEANDEFVAIHALLGGNYHFSKLLSANAEFGFDLVEEILDSEDRGDESINNEIDNHVDFSIAVGLMFNIDKSIYLKTYYRHHVFDGIFLPETKVDFTGVRLGINY